MQSVLHIKEYLPGLFLIFLLQSTFLKAQTTPAELKAALQNRRNDISKVDLLNRLSFSYVQTDLDSVWQYAQNAKSLSEKLAYTKGEADALVNYTRYYENKGDYSAAMRQGLNALQKYEALKATTDIGRTYLLLAMVSKDLSGQNRTNEYVDNGIAYIKSAFGIFKNLADTGGMSAALITSGILYRDKSIKTDRPGFYDTAFKKFSEALRLIKVSGKDSLQLPRLYNNISQVYLEHFKNYDKALEYLFKAVSINKANNNISSLSYNYGNISNAYLRMHVYDKALEYATKMLDVSKQLNRPSRMQNSLYQLFLVYDASGRPDSALHYYRLADDINDSLTDLAKTNQVMELQTKYRTGKKELEIRQLQIMSIAKNRQITIMAVALVMFGVFVTAMLMLYRRVQKQKEQISIQSGKLEVMMKELHHRVKNNLQIVSSLLSLQTYKLHDESTISLLRESQQRVQAMSLIHQRLYSSDELTNVNMKEYVTDLAETLMAAYGYSHDDFDLQLEIEKENLDVEKALPIGLIINEMVTNCMKYAYKNVSFPLLKISLKEDEKSLVLIVRDNGNGIDEKAWKQKSSSFGKQLITALGKQLRSEQSVKVHNGTEFMLTIPKNKAA